VLCAGRWAIEHRAIDPYAMIPVCIAVIALGALASYQVLEQATHRRLKHWFGIDDALPIRQKH